jgi:SAM-dependent methyltransferase
MPLSDDYTRYREVVGGSFAQWYGQRQDSWTGAPTNDAITAFVLDWAPSNGGQRLRVLDVGCGRGHQSTEIADRLDADVTGLDLLDVWAAPPPRRGRVENRLGDFLDYRGPAVDLLVDNGCLHHQRREDWLPWVRHGRELLRPGGTWVISIFLSPTGEVMRRPLPDGRLNWWITEDALAELLAQVGLVPAGRTEVDRDYVTRDGYQLSYLAVAFREA